MNQHGSGWTAERTEQLRTLLGEGKTAAEAAAALGISRGAAMGKAHRKNFPMNAPNDGGVRTKTGGVHPKPKSREFDMDRAIFKPKAAPKPQPIQRPNHAAPSLRLTVLDLRDNDCHFIEGERPYTYCGHPAIELRPYCMFHAALVYQPVRARMP